MNYIISPEDQERVDQHVWKPVYNRKGGNLYFYTCIGGKTVYLHRFIIGAVTGEIVDHINRNTLDNRRENLRIVSNRDNCLNKGTLSKHSNTGYRGVFFEKYTNKYRVQLKLEGKKKCFGRYTTLDEAVEVAAKALKGGGINATKH